MASSLIVKHLLLFFPLLFHLASASSFTTTAGIVEAKELVKWKDTLYADPATPNNSFFQLNSWTLQPVSNNDSSSSPPFQCMYWYGISCDNHGRIAHLNLTEIGFKGTLYDFPFSFLSDLVAFDLTSNSLFGTIPPYISNLSQLDYLSLANNKLSGKIPPQVGYLTKLIKLYLGINEFSGSIPSELGNLKSLEHLAIFDNHLTGFIPLELGNLTSLTWLQLHVNNLTGLIPSSLCNLTSLYSLYLSENDLYGFIPSELRNLQYLNSLQLASNHLSGGIPSSFSTLQNLNILYLHGNQLSGPIPLELGNLTSLGFLIISSNNFTVLPKHLCNDEFNNKCQNLIRVRLDGNHLTGQISEAFGVHPKLNYIDLSYNSLSGELSDKWSKCTKLTNFKVSNNNLTGKIPTWFGKLTKLGNLDLSMNHLMGSIPSQMWNLTSLVELNLSHNHILGSLPIEIGSLNRLQWLDLSANNLSDEVPKEISHCSNLLLLDLNTNRFSGHIPSELGSLESLQELLDLSRNQFTGNIPSELGNLKNLENLNLSHNILIGSIPKSLGNMDSLIVINVSYNSLEGPVPESKPFQNASIREFTHNKGLCGNVKALQACSSSETLASKKGNPVVTILLACLGGLFAIVVILIGICFIIVKKKRYEKEDIRVVGTHDLFDIFQQDTKNLYEEIITATEGFDDKHCIGVGSCGSVYKAVLSTGEIVAVKKLHMLQDDNEVDLKSFSAEVQALTELKHKNIVKLYGFCSHVLHSFLIYKYMENGSLAQVLKNTKEASSLDWVKRIKIIKDIANALSYMHHECSYPVIHRDISSKNILLNSKYDACVADFGIAKIMTSDSSYWTTPAGTYGYLAPEYAYTMKLTEKCDVYSFGVLIIEMIKGSHPKELILTLTSDPRSFQCMLLMEILDRRLLPPAHDVCKDIIMVIKLAFACLHVNPNSRPTMNVVSHQLSTHTSYIMEPFHSITLGQILCR